MEVIFSYAPLFPSARILRKIWLPLSLAACLLACSHSCGAQFNASFDSAYRAAAALPDPAARLTGLRPLVNTSYEASVFQTISYGKAFLQAATEVGSDTDLYQAHTILCAGYERSRDFEQATGNGLEAIRIAARRKDYLRQIRAFHGTASTYSSMGLMSGNKADFNKALYYCNEAMNLIRSHGIRSEESYLLTTTADIYAMSGQVDTAITLYRRVIALRKVQGTDSLPGGEAIYGNLGIALDINKDYEGALVAYATADSIAATHPNSAFSRLKIASNRAILYSEMGRLEESEQLTKEVLARAQQTGAMDVQVDMVDQLKNLSRKQGRYAEALVYADTLAAIKERKLNAGQTGQVAEMQARYDAGVKDQEIAGQAQTIKRNRQQNRLLWAGIALLAIAGGSAFGGLRRSRRLARRITAQRSQLESQKTELQRLNTIKDQLFSLIGHDLRAPLNSLSAYATLLEQQDVLPPEKVRAYSADMRQTLSYTAGLMENLLQFAKTQMNAIQPYAGMIPLSIVADDTAGLLQSAMAQKALDLIREFDTDTMAFADADMTELILRNLLGNAIKFSDAGSSITLSIRPQDEHYIACTVRDTGAGMTPDLVAVWNGASVPAPVRSAAGTQQEKGAGLGLMLSKTFASLMGGSLKVVSEVGQGSAFSLILPRQKPAG